LPINTTPPVVQLLKNQTSLLAALKSNYAMVLASKINVYNAKPDASQNLSKNENQLLQV